MMTQRLISVILAIILVVPSLYSPTFSMGADAHSITSTSLVTLSPPKGSGLLSTQTVSRGMYGESCPLAETGIADNPASATPSCALAGTTFHLQGLHGDFLIRLNIPGKYQGQNCSGQCDVTLTDGGGSVLVDGPTKQGVLVPTLCIAPNHSRWIYWGRAMLCPLPPRTLAQPASRGMYGERCHPAQTDVADNPASATPSCAPAGTTFHLQGLHGDFLIRLNIPGKYQGQNCSGQCDVTLTDGGGSVLVDGPTKQGVLVPTLCIAPNHSKWIYWSKLCPLPPSASSPSRPSLTLQSASAKNVWLFTTYKIGGAPTPYPWRETLGILVEYRKEPCATCDGGRRIVVLATEISAIVYARDINGAWGFRVIFTRAHVDYRDDRRVIRASAPNEDFHKPTSTIGPSHGRGSLEPRAYSQGLESRTPYVIPSATGSIKYFQANLNPRDSLNDSGYWAPLGDGVANVTVFIQ
jgi:hypothetical protein